MFVFQNNRLHQPKYFINFPTKRHWKGKSRMEDINSGLQALARDFEARQIRSIAIPPLGSGLGGLNWSDVRLRTEAVLQGVQNVYAPVGAPSPLEMASSSAVPNMTPGRAALVVLMDRYLSGLLDPFVSLLGVHKLMYFMEEAGQDLELDKAGPVWTLCGKAAFCSPCERGASDLRLR